MTALRVLNLLVWGTMAIVMARGAWAAASNRGARYGDPMRLAFFATAMIIMGFTGRWFIAAGNMLVWKLIYVLSAAVAAYIIVLGFRYGRGPKL